MTPSNPTVNDAGMSGGHSFTLPYQPARLRQEPALYPLNRSDFRNAILCGLAVIIAVLMTWPFAESPYNDDWSYSFTVRRLLETGRLTYNGWASASLIAQAYWGLLWVKVFGFSYTILRISTIPLAAAAISVCYLLARRAGLRPGFAVFASLMVGLSPIYLPVAGTFMTDAPGLFFIMLSMYGFVRAIESPRTSTAVSWLAMGIIVGLVGGTGRQIVWVVPLAVAPYAAWLRRDNLPVLAACVAGWMIVFAGALLTLHWFAHQPYSIPENSLRADLHLAFQQKAHYIISVLSIGLTLLWVILPALWGLTRGWNATRAAATLIVFIGPAIVLPIRPRYAVAPWMGNTLSYNGVMDGAELPGHRPDAMPKIVRIAFAIVVVAVACILIADLAIWTVSRPLTAWRKIKSFLLFPNSNQAVISAFLIFGSAYLILLLPRCATNMVYDRYMLPLMPCVLFPFLLSRQNRGEQSLPRLAIGLFAIYTVYAIAITQEVTALARARTSAADRLVAAGIPRTQIDAGFEYDNETQLETYGYINDPRLRQPKGAFKKNLDGTYALQPTYRLEFSHATDTAPTSFGSVTYFSYLYPFQRSIFIDKYTDPWWLNPRKAATRPTRHHYFIAPAGLPDDDDPK